MGELTLIGHEFQKPVGTSSAPANNGIIINKGYGRLTAIGNRISDLGTAASGGTNTFISIANDNFDRVIGNAAPGYTDSFPSSPVYGVYQSN